MVSTSSGWIMVQIIDDEVASTVDYEDLVQTIAIGCEVYVQSCDIHAFNKV